MWLGPWPVNLYCLKSKSHTINSRTKLLFQLKQNHKKDWVSGNDIWLWRLILTTGLIWPRTRLKLSKVWFFSSTMTQQILKFHHYFFWQKCTTNYIIASLGFSLIDALAEDFMVKDAIKNYYLFPMGLFKLLNSKHRKTFS